jgi:importin subunit beta-1
MTLISKDRLAKRSAADAISAVCSIELPKGEWPDIIFNLVANSKHENLEIRMSAIMTLGFICEQLREKN